MNGKQADFLVPARATEMPRVLAIGARVFLGVIIMALSAQARFPVPGTEVPATLQTLALLVIAFALPAAQATMVMVAYLGLGALGLPLFAPGSPGLGGSTGGFLIGFAIAAPAIAWLRGGKPTFFRLLGAGTVGMVLVFAAGNMWRWGLGTTVGGLGVTWRTTLATGLLPFVPKALVEIFLAATLVAALRRQRTSRLRFLAAH